MSNETEFKYRAIHTLFEEIKNAHMEHGSDPSEDYQLLRDIIEDGSIVRGNNRIRAFIYNIPKLKVKFPSKEHNNFIEWVYHVYRLHHEKVSDQIESAAESDASNVSNVSNVTNEHDDPVLVVRKPRIQKKSFFFGALIGGLAVHMVHALFRPRSHH